MSKRVNTSSKSTSAPRKTCRGRSGPEEVSPISLYNPCTICEEPAHSSCCGAAYCWPHHLTQHRVEQHQRVCWICHLPNKPGIWYEDAKQYKDTKQPIVMICCTVAWCQAHYAMHYNSHDDEDPPCTPTPA